MPGEASPAWGKGEVGPLVAAPGFFFLFQEILLLPKLAHST